MTIVGVLAIAVLAGLGYAYFIVGGNAVANAMLGVLNVVTGNLTAAQIGVYAQNAGFSGQALQTAVAIALAESAGDPGVYNPETQAGAAPGQGSYGLWQIYLTAHPEYANSNLYDPQTNANAAYAISGGGASFTAWTTYKSGAYQAFMQSAAAAVNA